MAANSRTKWAVHVSPSVEADGGGFAQNNKESKPSGKITPVSTTPAGGDVHPFPEPLSSGGMALDDGVPTDMPVGVDLIAGVYDGSDVEGDVADDLKHHDTDVIDGTVEARVEKEVLLSAAAKYKYNSTSTVMTARSTLAMPETHELLLTVATVIHCQLLADAAEQRPVSLLPVAGGENRGYDSNGAYIPIYDITARSDMHGSGKLSFGWDWNEAVIVHRQREEWLTKRAQAADVRAIPVPMVPVPVAMPPQPAPADGSLTANLKALSLATSAIPRTSEEGADDADSTNLAVLPGRIPGAFLENVNMLASLPQHLTSSNRNALPTVSEDAEDDDDDDGDGARVETFLNATGLTPLVTSARNVLAAAPTLNTSDLPMQAGESGPPSTFDSPPEPAVEAAEAPKSGSKRPRKHDSPAAEDTEAASRYATYLAQALEQETGHSSKRLRSSIPAPQAGTTTTQSGAAVVHMPSPAVSAVSAMSTDRPPLPPGEKLSGSTTTINSGPAAAPTAMHYPLPHLVSMTVPALPEVFNFLQALTLTAQFSPQCNLIALIYLNRLVAATGISLHAGNWRPLLLVALLLAQKVWDDRSLSSRDFAILCPIFSPPTIRRLERKFLIGLNYQVDVAQSLYAQYYFELRSLSSELTPSSFPLQPLSAAEARRLEMRSSIGKRLPSFAALRGVRSRGGGGATPVGATPYSSGTPLLSTASTALDLAVSPAVGQAVYTTPATRSRFVLS